MPDCGCVARMRRVRAFPGYMVCSQCGARRPAKRKLTPQKVGAKSKTTRPRKHAGGRKPQGRMPWPTGFGRPEHLKGSGPVATCGCGGCQKCKHREYMRQWRIENRFGSGLRSCLDPERWSDFAIYAGPPRQVSLFKARRVAC